MLNNLSLKKILENIIVVSNGSAEAASEFWYNKQFTKIESESENTPIFKRFSKSLTFDFCTAGQNL